MNALDELRRLLRVGPVMAECHILTPLALDPSVRIEPNALRVVAQWDSPFPQVPEMVMIQEIDGRWADRFAVWRDDSLPAVGEIDRHIAERLDYVRASVPSQSAAGARLRDQLQLGQYDCGILLLVDGLSYLDCFGWTERPDPCFVDGPTTTEFGFLEIMQASGLVTGLLKQGRYQLRAYSYWERDQNDLCDRVFRGVPLERVRHFGEALSRLQTDPLKGHFVFVLRDGLDDLAHRRREVPAHLRSAAIRAVHDDFQALTAVAKGCGYRALVGLLADHGVVWRDDREWRVIADRQHSWHARFSEFPPTAPGLATRLGGASSGAYCYHPGLLCREPRTNEAGFHGGLSAAESFVPFVVMEV